MIQITKEFKENKRKTFVHLQRENLPFQACIKTLKGAGSYPLRPPNPSSKGETRHGTFPIKHDPNNKRVQRK